MKRTIQIACVVMMCSSLTLTVSAKVITVGSGGGYHYSTIQAAINAASQGDTIRVADGVYTASNDNEVNMTLVENLTLEAETVGGAVIDGQGTSRAAVYIDNADRLRGFWIRNAEIGIQQRSGNGDSEAGPWIAERCVVTNTGLGVWINQSSSREGNGIVRNCTIYDVVYGGLGTNDGDTLEILNSLIVEVEATTPYLDWGVLAAVVEANSNSVSIDYSNIYNCGNNYNNLWGGLVVGSHMSYVDPLFVSGGLSLQPTSQVVDSGIIIDGLWGGYQGSAPDMGAFEVPEPTTVSLLAVGWLSVMRRRKRGMGK